MRRIDLIVDLQFGSTGKGLLAGILAKSQEPDTLITAWAPNAGHTFIDKDGRKFVHCMVPNGVVSPRLKRIMFGPGSVIDPEGMLKEFEELGYIVGPGVQIAIHENAAVRLPWHIVDEKRTMFKIGSTMKGVGEAVKAKISRNPDNRIIARDVLHAIESPLAKYLVNGMQWSELLSEAKSVQIEGHQGYSLSINHGFYPYTTSRDCTTLQILADCGIPFQDFSDCASRSAGVVVWGSARTYPIRVANRFDESGAMIGTSGPCYFDQKELEWRKDLGLEPELTTVTKLPRRIFSWSDYQVKSAIRENGVDKVFLNFCNYESGCEVLDRKIESIESTGVEVALLGFGPREDNVMTYWEYAARGDKHLPFGNQEAKNVT